jgi:transposase, IS30 family
MHMETNYTHLTLVDRDRIKALYDDGFSLRKIGRTLDVAHSTVSRELKRGQRGEHSQHGKPGGYEPLVAQHKAYLRRQGASYQGKKLETNLALRAYVIAGLTAGWNPDEISGYMKRTHQPFYASKTAIYEWLYSAYGQAYCRYLPRARYRPKRRRRGLKPGLTISGRVPITERPAGATNRSRYGHWEGDTMVSGKYTHSTTSLVVATERKTRYVVAGLIPDLAGETFSTTLSQLLDGKYIRSMTLDNGVENHAHQAFARTTGAATFFCDPYSSWQKGGVEHINKMIRSYIPKGSNLADYDQAYINYVVGRINNKPRRCLGYKSAVELAVEKGVIARESGALRG